jgi:hypothetical protein
MARLFLLVENVFAVYPDAFDTIPAPQDAVLIARYSEATYTELHQLMSVNVHLLNWNPVAEELKLGDDVLIDSVWIQARESELTQASDLKAAKVGLRDKMALAQTHAATITILFNAVLDQTVNQTVQPTRFDNLKAVIQNAPQAFRDRLITDCVQELGVDPTGVLTAPQQRQATLYLRAWVTPLALLLSLV